MVDPNAHEAGNGGKKPRAAYSLPSLLYSEVSRTERDIKGSVIQADERVQRSTPWAEILRRTFGDRTGGSTLFAFFFSL